MNEIVVTPNHIYYLIKNVHIILFTFILIFLLGVFDNFYNVLASGFIPLYDIIYYSVFILILLLIVFLIYNYIEIFYCTKWIITDDKIKIRKGVFFKSIDFIELYRVIDYSEKQTFIQQIFKLKDVIIHSGDKTDPFLRIYGISTSKDLITILRPLVEECKQKRKIVEITNTDNLI